MNCFDLKLIAGRCANGDVRLVEGANVMEGRVEICYEEVFGTVCNNGLDADTAVVVCRQLNYPSEHGMILARDLAYSDALASHAATILTGVFLLGPGPVLLDSLRCVGNESHLLDCGYDGSIGDTQCISAHSAGISCQRETSE